MRAKSELRLRTRKPIGVEMRLQRTRPCLPPDSASRRQILRGTVIRLQLGRVRGRLGAFLGYLWGGCTRVSACLRRSNALFFSLGMPAPKAQARSVNGSEVAND